MSEAEKGADSGAVFTFDDMKSLRDEYEERIRKLEEQLATQKTELEQKALNDGRARQELIEDLTVELATAREEGEKRARAAEAALHAVVNELARIEGDIARVRSTALSTAALDLGPPPATIVPATMPPMPAPAEAGVVNVTAHDVVASAPAPPEPAVAQPNVEPARGGLIQPSPAALAPPAPNTTMGANMASGAVPVATKPPPAPTEGGKKRRIRLR